MAIEPFVLPTLGIPAFLQILHSLLDRGVMTRRFVVLFVIFLFYSTRLKFHKVSRNRDLSSLHLFLSFHRVIVQTVTLSGFLTLIVLAGALKLNAASPLTSF